VASPATTWPPWSAPNSPALVSQGGVGQDIRDIDVLIREQELEQGVKPGTLALIPAIESAQGVLRCEEICAPRPA